MKVLFVKILQQSHYLAQHRHIHILLQ